MRRHGPVIAHCTDSEDFSVLKQVNSTVVIAVNDNDKIRTH